MMMRQLVVFLRHCDPAYLMECHAVLFYSRLLSLLYIQGYGFCHLPSTHGLREMRVPCWRPSGTPHEEMAAFFLGITPQLRSGDTIFNRAWWVSACSLFSSAVPDIYSMWSQGSEVLLGYLSFRHSPIAGQCCLQKSGREY